jgi:hypothetical protein
VPRYYFDLRDGDLASADDEGTELADLEEARTEALAMLGGIAKDELPDRDQREFVVIVRDGGGPQLSVSLTVRVERELARKG